MRIRTMRGTFQRLAIVAAAVCALVTGVSGQTVSASAAVADASLLNVCPADSLCLYQHRDFQGEFFVTASGTLLNDLRNFRCIDRAFKSRPCDARHDPDGSWNDMMSSWVNNTSLNYCWFFDINYGTGPLPIPIAMPAGQSLSVLHPALNDEASSMKPC
jgi:hypothetical protein